MGVFDDTKFEQLDWMTQMTETIDSDLNGLLARLPDRKVISKEEIIEACSSSYSSSLSVGTVVREMVKDLGTDHKYALSYEEDAQLRKCFKLQTDGTVEVDLEKNSVVGEVAIVKVVQTLSDEELQLFMGHKGIESLRRLDSNADSQALGALERYNEILDILGGCEEHMRNRSMRKKTNALVDRLRKIFATNEWRIRDMGLANKISFWIKGYINDGNLPCLMNLCKVKAMTHSNMPIYSVVEEK